MWALEERVRVGLVVVVGVVACSGPQEPARGTSTDVGTVYVSEPTQEPTSGVVAASCEATDNALRVRCSVELAEAGSTELTLSAQGVPTRTFVAPLAATRHSLLGWGLVASTRYTWTVGDVSGEIETGELPSDLGRLRVDASGEASGFDAVLRPVQCDSAFGQATFVMIDPQGRVVFYQDNEVFEPGGFGGYAWSQEHDTLLVSGANGFREQHVGGEIVLELAQGRDYQGRAHHDTDRWGDYRYVLFQRNVGGYTVDGVHVFDDDVLLGSWFMDEHFTVDGGSPDWSHGNSINVSDDGVIVLSFLTFSGVVAVDGDPASETFLEVLWHASGGPDRGLPDADFVAGAGSDGFRGQHDASVHGSALWLFDNSASRALRMELDAETGTLPVTGSWELATERNCTIQGGAVPTEDGVMVTCPGANRVSVFGEEETEPSWSMTAACGGFGGFLSMNRGIPIQIGLTR